MSDDELRAEVSAAVEVDVGEVADVMVDAAVVVSSPASSDGQPITIAPQSVVTSQGARWWREGSIAGPTRQNSHCCVATLHTDPAATKGQMFPKNASQGSPQVCAVWS